MKKLVYLSLCLTLPGLGAAQSSFQRHYGQPSNFDQVAGLAHTQDGHYLVAGTTANLGAGSYDMLFEKVGPNGNTVWQTTWGGAGNDGANHIIALSSGGFLVSGYTEGDNSDRDFAAVRLDEEGNELWRLVRGGAYEDEAVRALEMPDGGLLLVGLGVPEFPLARRILLILTAPDGTAVWEKTAGPAEASDFRGCAPAADGGFYILEWPNILIKFDGQGNRLWTIIVDNTASEDLEISHFGRAADGKLWIGGRRPGVGPFIAGLEENGDVGFYFEIPHPDPYLQVNSLAITPAGKAWVTFSRLNFSLSAFTNFLVLIDPVSAEVVLYRTVAELGLEEIAAPFSLFVDDNSEGFLLAANSFSNARGDNGLLYRANENAQEAWRKTIGVEGIHDGEIGRLVVETADGGFLVAGTRSTADEERNLWLIRTDANGNMRWTADLGSAQNDGIAALAVRDDGSYVVAGNHGDTLIVSAYDDAGIPLWYREYTTGVTEANFDMTITADNEILLTMPVWKDDDPFGYLIKLNAQGDSLWSRHYQPSIELSATYGITAAADGGYFLCGCAVDEEGDVAPLLLKTDADGNEIWAAIYEPDGNVTCLITARTGIGGDIFANGISTVDDINPYAMRFSPNGALAWAQTLELDADENSYFTWFSALHPNTGQQILFGGKSIASPLLAQGRTAGAITVLNPDGTLAWEKDYGKDKRGYFRGGGPTSDGGLVAVGDATFDNSQDVWLVKTEADGTVGFTASLAPPFELSLSPNPANGWLRVNASKLAPMQAELAIFNLNGQRLYSEAVQATGGQLNHDIRVESLAPGSYILHLRQGRKAMSVKWVKR